MDSLDFPAGFLLVAFFFTSGLLCKRRCCALIVWRSREGDVPPPRGKAPQMSLTESNGDARRVFLSGEETGSLSEKAREARRAEQRGSVRAPLPPEEPAGALLAASGLCFTSFPGKYSDYSLTAVSGFYFEELLS